METIDSNLNKSSFNIFNEKVTNYLEKKYKEDDSTKKIQMSSFIIAPLISMFGTIGLFLEGMINMLIYLIKNNEIMRNLSKKFLFIGIDLYELIFVWSKYFSNLLGDEELNMIKNSSEDLSNKIEKSTENLMNVICSINEENINSKFSEVD